MASLKEIKSRIASVKNTLKITSAMKLVASVKLHKAQMAIENIRPYNERLTGIANSLLDSGKVTDSFHSSLMEKREVKRVALVTISSSASLCGGFNNNIIRLAQHVIDEYREQDTDILLVPIGRKITQALTATINQLQVTSNHAAQNSSLISHNTSLITDYVSIGEKPTYAETSALASYITELYRTKKIDCVEILYTHYKNMAVQVLMRKQFLPVEIGQQTKLSGMKDSSNGSISNAQNPKTESGKEDTQSSAFHQRNSLSPTGQDFILEPSVPELLAALLPQILSMQMFAILLDSSASEHAARTFAMQQATDNGEGLLQELNLQYNKGRQQAITNELLDIMGGSLK